jgi:hypothetical protein
MNRHYKVVLIRLGRCIPRPNSSLMIISFQSEVGEVDHFWLSCGEPANE